MPTYHDYLYRSLLTKYGLPGLANSYIEQISTRLRRLGADHGNQYAIFIMQLLQDGQVREAEYPSAPVTYGQLEKVWSPVTQRVAIYAKKVFQEALINVSSGGSRSPTRKIATSASVQAQVLNISENMGEGVEASIFELLDIMSKDAPIN